MIQSLIREEWYPPLIGQENYYVCHELLGIPDEEIADLVARGIVQTQ